MKSAKFGKILTLFSLLVVALPASAKDVFPVAAESPWFDERTPIRYDSQRRIWVEFDNADLCYVLKVLAREMKLNYGLGPTVDGSVSVKVEGLTPTEALAEILNSTGNGYAFKITGTALIVASPENFSKIDTSRFLEVAEPIDYGLDDIRQEFLLESVPATEVVNALSLRYHRVKFIDHPTQNGFYAVGPVDDILLIERELRKSQE